MYILGKKKEREQILNNTLHTFTATGLWLRDLLLLLSASEIVSSTLHIYRVATDNIFEVFPSHN